MSYTENMGMHWNPSSEQTAKFYNWTITNQFENCAGGTLAKSRQKNTNKEKKPFSDMPGGESFFMNISMVQEKSFGGSKYWLLATDNVTDFCSKFLRSKDQTSTTMVLLIWNLKIDKAIVSNMILVQ